MCASNLSLFHVARISAEIDAPRRSQTNKHNHLKFHICRSIHVHLNAIYKNLRCKHFILRYILLLMSKVKYNRLYCCNLITRNVSLVKQSNRIFPFSASKIYAK